MNSVKKAGNGWNVTRLASLALFFAFSILAGAQARVIFYSDNTGSPNTLPYPGSGNFDGAAPAGFGAEGVKAFRITSGAEGFAGLALGYNTAADLSPYAGGVLKFLVNTPLDLKVDMEDGGGITYPSQFQAPVMISQYGWTLPNSWQEISIPLSAFTTLGMQLNNVKFAIKITIAGTNVTFYLDYVRIETASGFPQTSFGVNVRSVNNNAFATTIGFSQASAGSNVWKLADEYIQLTARDTRNGWGVQIYTNNKHAAANPRYTGTGDPAGLLSSAMTAIPLAWKALDGTAPYATLDNPQLRADRSGFVNYDWHFMKDLASPTWLNGSDYSMVAGDKGVHFGEGPADWVVSSDFVTQIYLVGNFQQATARPYSSNRITLEMFFQ